jgi:hypothetical protein
MEVIEYKIRNKIVKADKGIWPEGEIKCQMSDGSIGLTGSWTSGLIKKEKRSATKLFDDEDQDDSFTDLLYELRSASEKVESGPIYRCNILFKGNKVDFEYFYENAKFDSLAELESDMNGNLPNFIFERMLTKDIIAHIGDWEIDSAIFMFVPEQKKRGGPIPDILLDMYALVDWQSDTNNGGLNQYFARDCDYFGCYDREELYPRVLKAIKLVPHKASEDLYQEGIALYSHYYNRVNRAREVMEIPEIPKQEESDINERYFNIYSDLEKVRRQYVKENAEKYEVSS